MAALGSLLSLLHWNGRKGGNMQKNDNAHCFKRICESCGAFMPRSIATRTLRSARVLSEWLMAKMSHRYAKRKDENVCYVMSYWMSITSRGFNDTYGHDAGDMVRWHWLALIRGGVYYGPVIVRVRWGGEELLIVVPEYTHGQRLLWWNDFVKSVPKV